MANERLRDALRRSGFSSARLAAELDVDRKTVERWVSLGRVPYARHRQAVGSLLQEAESWLWPDALSQARADEASRSEVVEVLPRRAAIPGHVWLRFFEDACAFVDILVYAGLFLPEQTPAAINVMRGKAEAGARVRLLLGDPDSDAVRLRGQEEGIGDAVATKSANALALLRRPLRGVSNVQVRLHGTTLYTSIYRADDKMIANTHVHGLPAAQSPALSLRRLSAGGLFDTYAAMYDRIWDGAEPAWT